jgi:tyrosyl-DNA phosphodiesterase 2
MQTSGFTPGVFAPAAQVWQPLALGAPKPLHIAQLTVATWNVWFGQAYFAERCHATLALLESYQPDVITLQEVTPAFLHQVLDAPWIQTQYAVSDIHGDSVDPYGVLILSRLPIHDWTLFPVPSAMGRQLVVARAALNQSTTFASIHLESQSYAAPTRAKQLARIFPFLAADPHIILTGDFNFCASWDENQQLDPTYHDVWPLLHPTDPGFTENTDVNTMRFLHTAKRKHVRFDRTLLRSRQPGWRATQIQLFGTEPIHPTQPMVFPSDHFGLLSTFVWQP